MRKTVGILALQGAYQKHVDTLSALRITPVLVRRPEELKNCAALILPGGESTTISLLIQQYDLYEAIKIFAASHPVMGVCAGMIMMATEVDDKRVEPLGLIPFKALRNHYGRQVHSFTTAIKLADSDFNGNAFPATFIRAPGITDMAPQVKILACYKNEAVMIQADRHLALSFHPELSGDTRIHEYWLRNL